MEVIQTGRKEDPAWRAVRRWQGLRGEPKLAWRFLWDFSGGRPSTVVVMPADVGADQGTSDRGGRRAMEALVFAGLVEVIERAGGRWTIYLPDPLDVAKARRSRGCDGQGVLFEEADEPKTPPTDRLDETAAEAGPLPPRRPAILAGRGGCGSTSAAADVTAADVAPLPPPRLDLGDLDLGRKEFKPDLDLGDLGRRAQQRNLQEKSRAHRDPPQPHGGSGATSAAAETTVGPGPLGDVLARIAGRVPTADEQAGRVEQWIVLIRERVDDDGLRAAPCVRIATAICEGRFPDRELYRLLSALDERRRGGRLQGQGAAWKYFVGASQKRFIELGIPW